MIATQTYRERLPRAELSGDVACVWVLEVADDGPAYDHRTVPNGSVELWAELGTGRIGVTGVQRSATVSRLAPGTTVVGIRFQPVAAGPLLGLPSGELVDRELEADLVWGAGAVSLAERLAEAGSAAAAADLLEAELVTRSRDARRGDPVVAAAIGRLQPWRQTDVGAWAAGLFISPRQLRRRFVAALGYGPKTFQRLRRFQGFLALSQSLPDDLARLARDAGYADQAHLTRECSQLTGLTPRAFLDETLRSCGHNHDHAASYAGLRRALLAANGGRA